MLFFCVFIQSYPHVIHKQAKQTEFCLRMLEHKYFKSATCVIELYDLQKDNIHLHVFKICVYTGIYDTITIIPSEQSVLKRQLYAKIVHVFFAIGRRQRKRFLLYRE